MLPIGDEPNPRGVPWVNYSLIAVNVAVYLFISLPMSAQRPDPLDPQFVNYLRMMQAQTHVPVDYLVDRISSYDLFIFAHGYLPSAPSAVSLFTSMFLHAGFLHLAGNMLFLGIFGDNVELRFGRLGYLILYLCTGALGTLFFGFFQGAAGGVPLVGASGAISGVLGCYFVWFPNNVVKVLMVFGIVGVVRVPARWVLTFYLVVENLLPFLLNSEDGGVAHGAHIGGFLAGAAFAATVNRTKRASGDYSTPDAWRNLGAQQAKVDTLRTAMAEHRYDDALREYSLMPLGQRNQLSDEEVLVLADWLTEQRRYEPALALLQRFIATQPHSAMLPHAHLRAGLILMRPLARPTAAVQHFLSVLDMHPPDAIEQAARQALAEIDAARRN